MDDFNHKTVFVLDHTQYFGKTLISFLYIQSIESYQFVDCKGISGENAIQLEFVNCRGTETILPVEKV